MKLYELTLGSIQIGIFAASWIVLSAGAAAYSVFVIAIIANLVMLVIRVILVKDMINLPAKRYIREVLIPISGVVLLSASLAFVVHVMLPAGISSAVISALFSILASGVSMYLLGINAAERSRLNGMVLNRLRRATKMPKK
jgi:hypothetical protein